MNRVDWNEDRHVSLGLKEVRFNYLLSKEVKRLATWKQTELIRRQLPMLPAPHYEVPDDSYFEVGYANGCRFYKMMQTYRLSLYLYSQFNRLKDAINQTCQYFYEAFEVPQELQRPPLTTTNEGMMAYYQYENLKFFLSLDGGGFNTLTRPIQLQQTWLIAQIFGPTEQNSNAVVKEPLDQAAIEQKVQYIKYLECSKLGHILWDYIDSDTWTLRLDEKMIAKLPQLSDKDEEEHGKHASTLMTFCFYLAMAYNGMVNLCYDKYANLVNANQAWRLSPELEFSLQFLQVLTTRKTNFNKSAEGLQNDIKATIVVGQMLPYRVFETKHDTQFLSSVSKKQFILLTDLVTITKPASECTRKRIDPAHGKNKLTKEENKYYMALEKLDKIDFQCEWLELSEHLRLNDLCEFKLGIFDVFKKENCSRPTLPQFMKENVGCIKVNLGQESTFRMEQSTFDDLNTLETEKKDFVFDANRRIWVINPDLDMKDTITLIFKTDTNIDDLQWRADEFIVKQLSSEKNVEKLLQIIDQIPNLDIRLSALQQAVITSRENLLCLGRSGTGKTTSSILRLFAQEIMYMSLKKAQKIRRNKEIKTKMAKAYGTNEEQDDSTQVNVKLTSKDFLKPSFMKTVFISASPVLVNEVNRFYTNLRESIISYLKKKESEQIKQEKGGCKEEGPIEGEVRLQQEDLLKLIKIEADQIEQELATEQQMNIPAAFEDLKPVHFPLFLTLKQLLFMLDASLYDSFFFRDQENRIVGMDNNLTWHNENKGLFMINQQFKTDADYDKLLLDFTKEVMNDVDAEDLTKELQTDQIVEDSEKVQKLRSGGWRYKRQGNQQIQTYSKRYIYTRQQLSFEVDYDVFVSRFFTRFKQKSRTLQKQRKLSEALIWTEIFSVIKGGTDSTKYYGGILPARKYICECGSPTLTRHELQTVYWIFIEYEKWKEEQNAFDLMDLVIHLRKSNKVSSQWYQELRMDYLMIDEVQDLTPATLDLLIRLTRNKVFFAGDTAQTIAKGVGARFSDLQQLFKQLQINVIQLTTNYRSHGKILALANSVVNVIETLFPFSIDKLKKEESESDGLRPILLTALKPHELKRFFLGVQKEAESSHPQGFSGTKPQFGCSQVLIVRDQEMKDKVPEFLANMLCLTVYEAKGLEFDDVFLYNFFSGENIDASHWKLLNDIGIYEAISESKAQEEIFTKIDAFCAAATEEENQAVQSYYKGNNSKEILKSQQRMVNQSTKNRALIYRKYSLLCVELKYLYVAITRPRKRLIIYDDNIKVRQPIQRVWEALGIVNVVNSTIIENDRLPDEVAQIFNTGYIAEQKSSKAEWKIQGIKFFKKKCFDQAVKCFRFAEEPELVIRCIAYQSADLANAKVSQIESNVWRIKNSSTITKNEKRVIQKENKVIRTEAKNQFRLAGESFEECGLYVQAASCYFSAKAFERAGAVFEKLKQYSQAGECLMRLNTPTAMLKAAEMFEKGKLITRAIECYEQLGAWEQLLHCLHQNGNCFREDERQRLANRYIPIALNKLYLLLTNESQEVIALEKNKGAIQELKIKRKFENQDKIEEEDDEDEEISSSENSEVESVQSEVTQSVLDQSSVSQKVISIKKEAEPQSEVHIQVNLNQAAVINEQPRVQPVKNAEEGTRLSDLSYDIVDEDNLEEEKLELFEEIFQLDKKKSSVLEKKVSATIQKTQSQSEQIDTTAKDGEKKETEEDKEASFEVIKDERSNFSSDRLSQKPADTVPNEFEELAMSVADFDHLSQYDPDDEFLQNAHSISILESILSSKLNQSSDYSVIEGDGDDVSILSLNSSVKGSEHMRFIARHQKIEDKIVQKIIYYISLFSTEVRERLDELHISRQNKRQILDFQFKEEEEIKLDKVPVEFIEIVLNILEYYDLIRLGLIICNKFKLNHHIGKYVVQSCIKYSNLHMHRYCHFQLRPNQMSSILQFKQRQASIIAHEAMHNVLGLISPKYLTLKKFNEPLTPQNSLGLNNYKLMLQLGFWKKLVYITNGRTALGLCFKFNDLDNYRFITEKMVEADQVDRGITDEQYKEIGVCKLLLTYKCALASLYKETYALDLLDRQGNVWESQEIIEKRFAAIEMQMQDMFFTSSDDDSLQLVNDLVAIAKYMLQNWSKSIIDKKLIVNKAVDDKQLEQINKADKDKKDVYFELTRSTIENIITQKFLPEPKNDSEFLTQCCLAFYMISFHSLQRQLESVSLSPDFAHRFIIKLQSLLQFIDFKNLSSKTSSNRREGLAKKAFFACFNIHPLNQDDFTGEENENLFGEFKGRFYLMNVNSTLSDKLQDIQQKLLATTIGQQITKLFKDNAPRFFYQCTLKEKIEKKMRQLETDPYATQGMVKSSETNQLAAMIDLDLQFVMIPCQWANALIRNRMIRVHDLLHGIFAKQIHSSLNQAQTSDKDRIRLFAYRFNNNAERKSHSNKKDYDLHFSTVLINLMQGYSLTAPSSDERTLFKEHTQYKKIQNNLTITQVKKTGMSQKYSALIDAQQKDMYVGDIFATLFDDMLFSIGFCQVSSFKEMQAQLRHDPMLVQMALHLINVKDWRKIGEVDEQLFHRYLCYLNHANSALSLAGLQYVYIEHLRALRNHFKARNMHGPSLSNKEVMQQLAIQAAIKMSELNQLVVCGAISMAASKLCVFYKTVSSHIEPLNATRILEKAFYPVLTGMLGKAYVPVDICYYFDRNLDVYPLIAEAHANDPEVGEYQSDNEHEDNDWGPPMYTEWDKQEITEIKKQREQKLLNAIEDKLKPVLNYKPKGVELESVKQDQEILVTVISHVNDLLTHLNKEAFDINAAKTLFNILMTAAVNLKLVQFNHKKQVSGYLIKCGFKLLADCPISEYFDKISFQYFDCYDEQEIMGLKKMFADTEENMKYQFFAYQKYIAQIDVTECQQKSKQTNNQNIFNTTIIISNNNLRQQVKNLMARQTIKRCIRKIKTRQLLSSSTLATIQALKDFGLNIDLTGIDQSVFSVSGIENDLKSAVKYLQSVNQGLANLRQLVLSRSTYLSSSFDIMMFYATQKKLTSMQAELIDAAKQIVNEKLYPLRGYMHLEHSKIEQHASIEIRFGKEFSQVDTMLALWHMRSRATREQKEIEQQEQRTKRLNIKWNSWNALSKKKARLQQRIKQLQI